MSLSMNPRYTLPPLDMVIDLACPIAWPVVGGNGKVPLKHLEMQDESMGVSTPVKPSSSQILIAENTNLLPSIHQTIHHLYLQTLYLPNSLSPLSIFALDLLRLQIDPLSAPIVPQTDSESIQDDNRKERKKRKRMELLEQCMLDLTQVERKHRKLVSRVIQDALISELVGSPGPSTRVDPLSNVPPLTECEEGLSEEETDNIHQGLLLRKGCGRGDLALLEVGNGNVDVKKVGKKLSDELERREVLIQIILLLVHMIHVPPSKLSKRKRDRLASSHPADDAQRSLEMLMDRLTVWQVVGSLEEGKDDEKDWVMEFCEDVVERYFKDKFPDICAEFHLKVFGAPLSSTTSNIRTSSPEPMVANDTASLGSRAPSIPPRRSHSRMSSIDSRAESEFRRAGSVVSTGREEFVRSRSRSFDPERGGSLGPRGLGTSATNGSSATSANSSVNFLPVRRPTIRQASGKNLFRGREVGLSRTSSFSSGAGANAGKASGLGMKRTDSRQNMMMVVGKRKTLYVPQAQAGRKLSGDTLPGMTRPMLPPQQPSKTAETASTSSSTLVMATPSKPRPFGRSHTVGQVTRVIPATPTAEQPANFVADTPFNSGGKRRRMSEDTAPAKRPVFNPSWQGRDSQSGVSNPAATADEDALGQLMVDSDNEDDRNDIGRPGFGSYASHLVPETPRKG